MKKVALIIAIVCCSAKSFCQSYPTPVTDTLGYLRHLVANKQQFIGQPFSVLNDSLKIQIKYFSPFGAYHHDQSKETDSEFGFNNSIDIADFYLTYPRIRIYWQQPLGLYQAIQLTYLYNGSMVAWGTRAYQHYANAVVKDVRLVE
jgi:hypothetical protein